MVAETEQVILLRYQVRELEKQVAEMRAIPTCDRCPQHAVICFIGTAYEKRIYRCEDCCDDPRLVSIATTHAAQEHTKAVRFEAAIINHRLSTVGHGMCHENDAELWRILGDSDPVDHRPPNWFAFMLRCFLYRWSKRGAGGCAGCPVEKKP